MEIKGAWTIMVDNKIIYIDYKIEGLLHSGLNLS